MNIKELVVNWHITESCNFKCQYCFAHWNKPCKVELLHSEYDIKALLNQISDMTNIIENKTGIKFESLRLNLVGGETFLYKNQVKYIIKEAVNLGFKLSAITNGSRLNDDLIYLIGKYFDTIGFSVDSISDETNILIGRTLKDRAVQANDILEIIAKIRQVNANISIKINTVVNNLNYSENLMDFITKVNPNKWKIFKMLPITTNNLCISDEQFQQFLLNHNDLVEIISAEDNDEMTQSYLMIDPLGRFFQNEGKNQEGYSYSEPILQVGIEKAFSQIKFDLSKFNQRYR